MRSPGVDNKFSINICDAGLILGVAAHIWLQQCWGPHPVFPSGYALLAPIPLAMLSGFIIPELRQLFQSLNIFLLCLATAPLIAAIPLQNVILQEWLTICLLYGTYFSSTAFLCRSFGLGFKEAYRDSGLRGLLRFSDLVAATAACGETFILGLSDDRSRFVFATWLWLVPFIVRHILLWRRFPPPIAVQYLHDAELWRRVIQPRFIGLVTAWISFVGFLAAFYVWKTWGMFQFMLEPAYKTPDPFIVLQVVQAKLAFFLWFPVVGMLLLQMLLVLQIHSWARFTHLPDLKVRTTRIEPVV